MKKMYWLERGSYSDYEVLGVYTEHYLAEQAKDVYDSVHRYDTCDIVEIEVDVIPEKYMHYHLKRKLVAERHKGGIMVGLTAIEEVGPAVRLGKPEKVRHWTTGFTLHVSGHDLDQCRKVMGEQSPALAERAEDFAERALKSLVKDTEKIQFAIWSGEVDGQE